MRHALLVLAVAVLGACASNPRVEDGKLLISQGRTEEGLARLERAVRERPRDLEARSTYLTQREAIAGTSVRDGDAMRLWGNLDAAEANYRRALQIDPNLPSAQQGLEAIARERRHLTMVNEAEQALKRGDLATADQKTRTVLAENSGNRGARAVMRIIAERRAQDQTAAPILNIGTVPPISLEFRDTNIRSVFEFIAKAAGLNFVFDRDVRPDLRVTMFVRNNKLEDILKILLVTNQLERKVLNDNTLLIYPNTPAKQKEYQELVVRSFYLANADVKQTATMLRALAKTRDIFIDEKLNLLVIKDTVEGVRLAEQLVATQDLGEPEVMLEVEVLEVASSRIRDFGLQYPERVNFGLLGAPGAIAGGTLPPFAELKPRDFQYFVANPALILNLRQLDGRANLLANPRIRVRNREKAKIHIGEKVPVITTTATINVGLASSVSYLDVGLKLDVEPNVYLEDEVAMKVQLEVSNILEQLNIANTVSYRVGTRNTSTTLRLKDGETQVLAGLINDEDRRAANKLPYLGDFPVVGQLFRSDNTQRSKTEIVLLITPHVLRNLARPDTVAAQFAAGSDSAPGALPLRLSATAPGSLGLAPDAANAGRKPPATPSGAPPQASSAPSGGALQETVKLDASGPAQVGIGQEYVLSLALEAGSQGASATVEVAYDPKVFALVGGETAPPLTPGGPPPPDPGRVLVPVSASGIAGAPPTPVTVRLRVVATQPMTTSIGIETLNATDAGKREISVLTPAARSVSIVASGAAK